MQQENITGHRDVVCIKIGAGEKAFFIPMDKIEGVCMNPELVKIPEAPDRIIGLYLGEKGPIPYISLEAGSRLKGEDSWRCGVEIINTDGQKLGILCARIEEEVEISSEILEEQAALWGSVAY